jgi:hypothetical protein
VGDGVAALSAAPASAPVFLEEYAGGVLVQAVAQTLGPVQAKVLLTLLMALVKARGTVMT